jgi:hypothetical protein
MQGGAKTNCLLARSLAHTQTTLPLSYTPDPPRPFDFVIDGELLRKSLEQHLLEHKISPVRA